MSRILFAVSGLVAAKRSLEFVADLAKRLSAEVLVVHVSRPASGQIREAEQARGDEAINLLKTELEQRRIVVQTLMLFSDDIALALAAIAAQREATLILMGLSGKNLVARFLAGNVPVELLKHTPVPVLLTPNKWTKPL
jgi:nucleotide-binding universal stress UspA family protein